MEKICSWWLSLSSQNIPTNSYKTTTLLWGKQHHDLNGNVGCFGFITAVRTISKNHSRSHDVAIFLRPFLFYHKLWYTVFIWFTINLHYSNDWDRATYWIHIQETKSCWSAPKIIKLYEESGAIHWLLFDGWQQCHSLPQGCSCCFDLAQVEYTGPSTLISFF